MNAPPPSPSATVLVVDDDRHVRDAITRALRIDGYATAAADDGPAALEQLAERPYDLVLLDIGLPGLDGLEVARRVRHAGDDTPILMVTAREAVSDRVDGLDAGADDYLVKPFALAELRARVRALLRRRLPSDDESTAGSVLEFQDLRLDLHTFDVTRGDRRIQLTRTELSLLRFFMTHPQQVLTRTQLFDGVWGYDFGPTSNALGVYIGYLRRKLEADGEPRLLWTVRGLGYILRAQ